MKKIGKNKCGFTLAEMLIAAVILVMVFVFMLLVFIKCLELSEMARNTSNATFAAKSRMEAIRNTDFDQIFATYNNVSFVPTNINGIGVSYVDNSNPDLLKITVSVCWRQKNGRVIGEDKDLNGILDAGEDLVPANSMIDSMVQLVTNVFDG